MKVHITGGKGFLGRYVAEALGGGFEVEISDVDTLDVVDRAATVELLGASAPDVVCHLAGLTGAGASLREPRTFFETNCVGTLNVLEACRSAKIGGLVFLSSLTVHGQSPDPVDEETSLRPRHPYAGSKASAELTVQTYARCFGIRSAILRVTLIAGEGQKEPNAVSDFVDATLRGEARGAGSRPRCIQSCRPARTLCIHRLRPPPRASPFAAAHRSPGKDRS